MPLPVNQLSTKTETEHGLISTPEALESILCALGVGFLWSGRADRLYNRKIATGLLWFFTGGLFGVGQLIDVFLVAGMAESHQSKRLWSKYGDRIDQLLEQPPVTHTVVPPSREEKMINLLKAAQKYRGQLSVTQAVLETGMGFEEVEALLQDMLKLGYVGINNHPDTGIVLYYFNELIP